MNTHAEVRWGIVGTGGITRKFAQGLSCARNARLHAIASRDPEKARLVAEELGIAKAYGDYAALLADPDIDIVYIATPNHRHCQDVLMALDAGKAVLCEKPFALNAEQARMMLAKAREKKLFLMEALWTRFLPSLLTLERMIREGAIGEVRLLRADFGFRAYYDAHSRLFAPELGGGSLYDIGIYSLFLALLLFGKPTTVHAVARLAPTGVDNTAAILLEHEQGRISQLTSSFELDLETEAHVYGTQGKLVLHRRFHMPTQLTLHNSEGIHPVILNEEKGNGYQYQAEAAMECLRNQEIECPPWSHNHTLELMELIDRCYTLLRQNNRSESQ